MCESRCPAAARGARHRQDCAPAASTTAAAPRTATRCGSRSRSAMFLLRAASAADALRLRHTRRRICCLVSPEMSGNASSRLTSGLNPEASRRAYAEPRRRSATRDARFVLRFQRFEAENPARSALLDFRFAIGRRRRTATLLRVSGAGCHSAARVFARPRRCRIPPQSAPSRPAPRDSNSRL